MAVRDQTDQMFAGNDRVLRFTMTDEDAGGDFDLTLAGRVSRFALAQIGPNGPITATPVVTKDQGNPGEITLDPIHGLGTNIANVNLVGADTAALADAGSTDYYFEYEVTEAGGGTIVMATGTLTIDPNVVNP